MSAIPIDRPYPVPEQTSTQTKRRVRTADLEIGEQNRFSAPSTPSVATQSTIKSSDLLGSIAVFVAVVVATYGISSLFGQVLAEQARRDRIHSQDRMRVAQRAETSFESQMDGAVRLSSVEDWATNHGFVSAAYAGAISMPGQSTHNPIPKANPIHVNQNGTLVASRR